MLFPTIIAAALASTSVSAASYCATTGNTNSQYCLYSNVTKDGTGVYVTLHSAGLGWAAWGVGADMSPASVTVAWPYNGTYVVSDRASSGHKLPVYTAGASQISVLQANLSVAAPSWAKIAFTVLRPLDKDITPSTNYIYAYSDSPVVSANPGAAFKKHDDADQPGALDFTK